MYSVIAEARSRSLLELLVNRPVSGELQPEELREGQRRIASLQRRLLSTTEPRVRRQLLEQIFAAEERMAPAATWLFDRTRLPGGQRASTLRDLQQALRRDELFLEFALLDSRSYVVVVTSATPRVQELPGRSDLRELVDRLLRATGDNQQVDAESTALGGALLRSIEELRQKTRLVISPDGDLHRVPFELLSFSNRRILDSHIVSYTPSGAVLMLLRRDGVRKSRGGGRRVLSVSGSPDVATQLTRRRLSLGARTTSIRRSFVRSRGGSLSERRTGLVSERRLQIRGHAACLLLVRYAT